MKQRVHLQTRRVAAVAFISAAFCVTLSTFPGSVAADIVGVQTKPLLPGGGTCVPLTAYGFTPYIYDGALHSFEFTVPDRSYVALTGTVGDTFVPFQYMTRHGDVSTLRVHVDIDSTPVRGALPLSVTLISAKGSQQPVCMSTVIMTASLAEGRQSSVSVTPAPTVPSRAVTPSPTVPPVIGKASGPSMEEQATTTSGGIVSAPSDEALSPSMFANLQNSIVQSCMIEGGAVRLWIVLIAIFIVITAVAVLSQISTSYSRGQRIATIVIPLILLLAFWYMVESCRATVWAPVAANIVAVLGILGLYWNDPRLTAYTDRAKKMTGGTSSSKPGSPTIPMITPPPSQKPKYPESGPKSSS